MESCGSLHQRGRPSLVLETPDQNGEKDRKECGRKRIVQPKKQVFNIILLANLTVQQSGDINHAKYSPKISRLKFGQDSTQQTKYQVLAVNCL